MTKPLTCRVEALEQRVDSDDQTLAVDCDAAELAISGGNAVSLTQLGTVTAYRETSTPGVNVRRWTTPPDAVPHDLPAAIWVGPIDPATGFPTHPNTATVDAVEPDFTVAGPDDQLEVWGWVTIAAGGGFLRDINGNTGELGEVWIGLCGGTPQLQPGGAQSGIDSGTAGTDQFVLDVVPIPEGTHFIYFRSSDFSANQGINLQFSTDAATWSQVSGLSTARPVVECMQYPACEPLPEGWDTCPPVQCAPVLSPGVVVEVPQPSSVVPVPDNHDDAAVRTGVIGTSLEYARADHSHPIRRQTHPEWPGATYTNATLSGEVVLDRRSTETWVEFEVRWDLELAAGNNWPIVSIPAIAGYQQPIIVVTNTYRNQTTTFQSDDDDTPTGVAAGAAPVGPYMGIEWSHWSSTRGLRGPYRREVAYRQFVSASITYVRL